VPASSIVPPPGAPPPPPPAYPDPIHLPASPHGDPHAAHLLAQAYRDLADRFDRAAAQVSAISADLATRWHGYGSTALHTPTQTVEGNLRALASSYRQAADHLEEYATALHKAQHHHGWSLGKIIAIGAVVTVTAVAVVVTVGAAAPVGTLAAAEVGEAIIGAEAAAAGATAAETAATSGLALTAQGMSGLRTLTALALPHLTQGAVSAGIDTGLHVATGHGISEGELTESFLAGTLGSATTSATRSALRSSETYVGAGTLTKAALDTTALSATLTADTALGQYASTGHVDPTALTEAALLSAITGGAATLRHPLEGTGAIAMPTPRGQSLRDLMENGFHPQIHEGPWPWGHAMARHVAQTKAQLEARLASDPALRYASTFYDMAALTRAGNTALHQNPEAITKVLSGASKSETLTIRLVEPLGTVLSRGGRSTNTNVAKVVIVKVGDNLLIRTAFVELP
jgi:hypothetical protein